jgi:two-component system aerobic respiration control protein ArcA
MGKSFDAKGFVKSVEDAIKDKLRDEGLVSLDQYRKIHHKDRVPKVLIVEDDESVRRSLVQIVEKIGLRTVTAPDGSRLGEVLDSDPVDLIILDVGLPWLDGYELATLMKDNPDLRTIPLIFVSAYCSKDDIKKGFSVGADDYIKKPFEIDEVQRAVSTLLLLRDA